MIFYIINKYIYSKIASTINEVINSSSFFNEEKRIFEVHVELLLEVHVELLLEVKYLQC
jgi:hypothetical protein